MKKKLLTGVGIILSGCLFGQTTVWIDKTDGGLCFEGVGAVSAGASSRLLKDYPEPYRSEILDYLFKPGFGASLQHFKFEIGGDMNSTCGTEPAHARSRAEMLCPEKSYFDRGYESWMACEARKRNPDICLDVLQWGAPGWLEGGFYSRDNALYVVSYIQGLKRYYNLDVSYCGLWNEKHLPAPSRDYAVKHLRPALDEAGLNGVKIVGNDMYCNSPSHHRPWSYAEELAGDSLLRQAIGVLGYHYLTAEATPEAKGLGIPIWESEASILTGSWEHALKFIRNANLNYIKSRAVKTIIWNPVDAYYPNVSWNHVGMMEAKTPWCGFYEVRPAVWAVAHITQFVRPGWRYLDKGCGVTEGGSSYVTLCDEASGHFSIVLAGGEKEEVFDLRLMNRKQVVLQVWKSDEAEQFVQAGTIRLRNGRALFKSAPNTVYTLTTTTGQHKGVPAHPVPGKKPFPLPYRENFETYRVNQTPAYLSDQGGAFEVKEDREGNKYLQQVITTPLICWDSWGANNPEPFTQFGDAGYSNYEIAADVRIPSGGVATVYGRVFWFESNTAPHGVGFRLKENGEWSLIFNQNVQETGTVALSAGQEWHRVRLSFAGDEVQVFCDDASLGRYMLPAGLTKGLAGVGCNWTEVCFGNLSLKVVY